MDALFTAAHVTLIIVNYPDISICRKINSILQYKIHAQLSF
jgi:hypothetical protein